MSIEQQNTVKEFIPLKLITFDDITFNYDNTHLKGKDKVVFDTIFGRVKEFRMNSPQELYEIIMGGYQSSPAIQSIIIELSKSLQYKASQDVYTNKECIEKQEEQYLPIKSTNGEFKKFDYNLLNATNINVVTILMPLLYNIIAFNINLFFSSQSKFVFA